jgi:hypothetical protein
MAMGLGLGRSGGGRDARAPSVTTVHAGDHNILVRPHTRPGRQAPRTRDFPGEAFRVLKERELREYGEYRTRRLVLEAWDRPAEVAPAIAAVSSINLRTNGYE